MHIGKVHDAYRKLDDVRKQYMEENEMENEDQLLITSIDVSSAFDAIEHDYLYKYLEKTNIPNSIIKTLKYNYEGITATIKNGSKKKFVFSRGIPQGSALSGLLFTLALSPILRSIRLNNRIEPVNKLDYDIKRMKGQDKNKDMLQKKRSDRTWEKTSSYADDVTVMSKMKKSCVDEIIGTYKKHQEITGICVNDSKTELYCVRNNMIKEAKTIASQTGTKEVSSLKIRYLGHECIPTSKTNTAQIKTIINSTRNDIIKMARAQRTTIQGRVANATSLLTAKFKFFCYAIDDFTSKEDKEEISKLQTSVTKYVSPITTGHSRYLRIKNGGSGVPNLSNILASTKALHFKQLFQAKTPHHQYVKDVATSNGFELNILPLLGEQAWKSTEKILERGNLPFWSGVFKSIRKVLFPTKSRKKSYNILNKPIFDSNFRNMNIYKLLKQCNKDEITGRNPVWSTFIGEINKIGHIVLTRTVSHLTTLKEKFPTPVSTGTSTTTSAYCRWSRYGAGTRSK